VQNALQQPQNIVVLGGGSDIARAIVRALDAPTLQRVILAARRPAGIDTAGLCEHAEVVTVRFDATEHATHEAFVDALAADYGDLDIVIQAFGQLGVDDGDDPEAAARLAEVNYVGALSSGLAVARRLRAQGHGTLIVLSSVAGLRTRPSNFVYGSTKAAQDAFSTGLGHALRGSGARVLTVRPGFVRSSMTTGLDEAPFAVDPDDVAEATLRGLRKGSDVVYAPGILRLVFGILRLVPGPIWRRLDR
jgi:decaprenylphospho-beta-D-erythro-pentofuranosid-2-ulose 2-reductase